MNIEKIEEYKKFYHDTLLNDVVPFWEKSDLIDRNTAGYIISVIYSIARANNSNTI